MRTRAGKDARARNCKSAAPNTPNCTREGNIPRACSTRARSRRGFTLTETLMALLILGLLSAMVASAIPSAMRAYTDAVNGSNARTALSTATEALRNELGMASAFEAAGSEDSGYLIKYTDGRGRTAVLRNSNASIGTDADAVMGKGIEKAYEADGSIGEYTAIVPNSAMTQDLGVVCAGIEFDATRNVFEVSGLEVRDKNQNVLASVPGTYVIRAMGIA